MYSHRDGERKPSVAEVTSRLREAEDRDLAARLQQEEYDGMYERNRCERRLVSGDTRQSLSVHRLETQQWRDGRRRLEESDEEVARRLQEEMDAEAEAGRLGGEEILAQLRADEEFARQLMEAEQRRLAGESAAAGERDAALAAELAAQMEGARVDVEAPQAQTPAHHNRPNTLPDDVYEFVPRTSVIAPTPPTQAPPPNIDYGSPVDWPLPPTVDDLLAMGPSLPAELSAPPQQAPPPPPTLPMRPAPTPLAPPMQGAPPTEAPPMQPALSIRAAPPPEAPPSRVVRGGVALPGLARLAESPTTTLSANNPFLSDINDEFGLGPRRLQ